MVEAAFRPAEEEPRSLLDFVDEQGVEGMRDTLKDSIRESRVSIQSRYDCLRLITTAGDTDRVRLHHAGFRR